MENPPAYHIKVRGLRIFYLLKIDMVLLFNLDKMEPHI